VTRAGCVWRKANTYVRYGQHAKAIKWLSRTVAILDGEWFDGVEASYILGALVVVISLWVAG
jgi:hypothetical protein